MTKRGFAFFLCLALLAVLIVPAGAEQEAKFLHTVTVIDDSALYLAGAPAEDGTVSVTANGQSVPCTLSTLEESALPVTYYCIVDQSSSFSNNQKQQQLRALQALSEALRPGDSMVLYLMGEELTYGEPLTTAEARAQEIEKACVYTAKYTSLNASIFSAVERITASQDGKSVSCILLITDGLDNARVEVAQEQVFQSIHASGISFCTLSVVDPWGDKAAQNNASRMADYAKQSLGGVAVIPTRNFDSPTCVEDSVSEIVAGILSGSVLRLELSQLPTAGSQLELQVTWAKEGAQIVDQRSVDAGLLPAPTEPPQPETTEPETTEPTEAETTQATVPEVTEAAVPETTEATEAAVAETTEAAVPETTLATVPRATRPAAAQTQDSGKGSLVLILVIAGFFLVAGLVALAIVLWRKQRELEQEEPGSSETEEEIPLPPVPEDKDDFPSLAELNSRLVFKKEPIRDMPMPQVNIPIRTPDNTPGCRVRLVPENHPEGTLEFTIGVNESVTLGRNSRSDIVLNETDSALSSLHFELQWDSRSLHLRDRKSTNGTALNGVPLRPEVWVRVEKKAVIQAGSTKYTVIAEKK